jgi:anti-sigma28 factor (negative regulator of flagellin synthesis)
MRVASNNVDQLGPGGPRAVGTAAPDAKTVSNGGATSDSVRLSSAANLVALAKSASAARQSKIQDLGNQVRSGAYQTDNAQLSQAVVQGHIGQ